MDSNPTACTGPKLCLAAAAGAVGAQGKPWQRKLRGAARVHVRTRACVRRCTGGGGWRETHQLRQKLSAHRCLLLLPEASAKAVLKREAVSSNPTPLAASSHGPFSQYLEMFLLPRLVILLNLHRTSPQDFKADDLSKFT